jgi:hypothetical protein
MQHRSVLSLALLSAVALAAFEESFVDSTLAGNRTIVIRVTGGELLVDRTAGTFSVALERQFFQLDTVAGQPVARLLQRSTSRDRGRVLDDATSTSMVLESALFSGLVHPLTLLSGKAQARIREPGSDLVVAAEFTPKG